MAKDYYTKEEVDKIINDLRTEFENMLKPSIDGVNSFLFKHRSGRLNRSIDLLRTLLIENEMIEDVDFKTFFKAFSERDISGSNNPIITWTGTQVLCVYFLDELDEHFLLDRNKIDLKTKMIFGINNPSVLRSRYKNNSNGLPVNHEIIDKIIQEVNASVRRELEDAQYILDNPDLFGLNDLP